MPDAVHILAWPDPVAAFARAHEAGRPVALDTSGTTGRRRTVVRTTRSWVLSFPHVSALLRLDRSSRVWIPGPLSATANLFAAVHADWAGASRVDGPEDATHAYLTPTALRREVTTRAGAMAGLQVLAAGDGLDRATYDAAGDAGARVSHYYGAAELSFVAWGAHAGQLRPFPGVEVSARDAELWVRSPYLCDGYVEPGLAPRRDADGWMTVGDRGQITGELVTVRGRAGGITTGGMTVLVADIEHLLRQHAYGEVLVVGAPHPELGQVVVAVVSEHEDVRRLRAATRRLLLPGQRPRRWVRLAAFPMTANGKIDRAAVAAQVAGGGR